MEENIIKDIRGRFKEKIKELKEASPSRTYIYVSREDLVEIVKYLFKDRGARFVIASGVDVRDGVEVLYHMAFDGEGRIVTVKVLAPKSDLKLESITKFIPGALWIEREIHELFGVDFTGHPELKRLLLSDDWPAGVYPFRKEEEIGEE